MEPLLMQLRDLFAGAAFPWAVCGGYGLELFAGRPIRPHGDIDLCLPEAARPEVIGFLLAKGWRLLEYRGMGKVKPLLHPEDSEPGRNLMAVLGEDVPVQFFPCEEEGLLYHQFTPGLTKLNFIDLLFQPVQEKAFLLRDGLPILAPEIALLYKAARPEEEAARQDFDAVYPLLDEAQRQWLHAALTRQFPGHVWLQHADVQKE